MGAQSVTGDFRIALAAANRDLPSDLFGLNRLVVASTRGDAKAGARGIVRTYYIDLRPVQTDGSKRAVVCLSNLAAFPSRRKRWPLPMAVRNGLRNRPAMHLRSTAIPMTS